MPRSMTKSPPPVPPQIPRGIDPKMDEQALLMTLRQGRLTPDQFSNIMDMILVACYDRKVERGFMCEMIHRTSEIHRCLSMIDEAVCIELARRAQPVQATRARAKKQVPALDPAAITSPAIEGLTATFKNLRGQLGDKLELLTKCATAADTIS